MIELSRMREMVERLAALPGVSGMEQLIVKALREELQPFADSLEVDTFGNIIAVRRGRVEKPSLMIAAHSDEAGALITALDERGFLCFQTVGAVNPAILPGTRVRVGGQFLGVVGSIPGHLASHSDARQVLPAEELHIDIGAESEQQARAWGVREGTGVVFESPVVSLANPNMLMGKALDNRIGCAVLIATFEMLAQATLPNTVYGAINVLEEIGMRGARMTAAQVDPDLAIVLDTVPANDTPMANRQAGSFRIGGGPVVQLWEGRADLFMGTVAHPGVRDLILCAAEEERIEVQLSAAYGAWLTDGAVIHTTGRGIPTGFLSIPRRYAHTPNEIVNLEDAQKIVSLLYVIATRSIADFRGDFLETKG